MKREYSTEIAEQLITLVRKGVPIRDVSIDGKVVIIGAASIVGVDSETVYGWLQAHPEFQNKMKSVKSARREASFAFADRIRSMNADDTSLQGDNKWKH